MMDLSFLKNVEVKEVAVKAKAERVKLDKSPVMGAHFRVYKNGRIFTADATAVEFHLEFGAKEEIIVPGKDSSEDKTKEIAAGCGLDIFSSENWQMIAVPQPMLFIAIVPRNGNPKIDVYGSSSYDDDGQPKRSIHSNTVSSFGKDWLVPQLETLYGIDFEEVDFVDLIMNVEYGIEAPKTPNGDRMYSIPKTVSRGENKGDLVFLTRKNVLVYPLTVFEEPATEDPDQVDLEDSIAEIAGEAEVKEVIVKEVTTDQTEEPDGEFEEPSVDNGFSTTAKKKAKTKA
jgi:hypothetical protein